MITSHPDRTFQLWDYNVGHQRMLLRSPKNGSNRLNVDLKFYGVSYVSLPTLLRGVSVREATEDETSKLASTMDDAALRERRVFVLQTQRRDYAIVAAHMREDHNEQDWSESPFAKSDG